MGTFANLPPFGLANMHRRISISNGNSYKDNDNDNNTKQNTKRNTKKKVIVDRYRVQERNSRVLTTLAETVTRPTAQPTI